ncbi:low-specificity L-threonine aldolase [Leeia oryzae]|uniref:low-specificity L-threonine aldolase n=1 Tax=Leeia oryzae TaxID=356662 RepID=UPI00035E6101|nr:low-specificity L-threonine aldolase [Leeia oryzae]
MYPTQQSDSGDLNVVADFRSDTVTRPTPEIRALMATAPVGDDVFGDDPSINHLESFAAEMMGFEAALFAPSGTQTNLIGLMTHCQRGDEYIVGQEAHTYKYEGGGAAVLGSIQPQPLNNQPDGSIAIKDILAAIKPDDCHFAKTRLLALENTIGGRVLPMSYVKEATDAVKQRGLATHLDGARLFNAAVALGVEPHHIARSFDSASICLSKGLGAPVGSLLLGNKDFIKAARRYRKMLGGGMRQAGVLAVAGEYVLKHHVERLAEDHYHAKRLAEGLASTGVLKVTEPQTNILFVEVPQEIATEFAAYLQQQRILVTGTTLQRWVTHLDVTRSHVDESIRIVRRFFEGA